jgi:hypothetical protein
MPPYKHGNTRAWGRHYGNDFGGGTAIPMLLAMGSAVATPANYAAYSFDGGVTFAACTVPDPAGGLFGAAYSESLGYGIMISAQGEVFRSFDGITWVVFPGNMANRNWQGGVIRNADDTLFVASSLTSTIFGTSPDGSTWTERIGPSGSHGSVCRISSNGKIVACGAGGIARSLDGGITWGDITSPGDTNDDIGVDGDYLHVVGNTSSNAGDTYFSNNFGTTWTKCLRDAANDPPNCQAAAVDPVNSRIYQGGTAGVDAIWSAVKGNANNPPANGWTLEYPQEVGSGCRGGYIPELDKVIFVDHGGSAGFRTHQKINGVWSTTDWPLLLVNTARVRLQFLGFNNPL